MAPKKDVASRGFMASENGNSADGNSAICNAMSRIFGNPEWSSESITICARKKNKSKSHIKRPMNAFMVYAQAARRKVAGEYPNLSYAQLSKTLGKLWRLLDVKEKRPFIEEAERLRQQHKVDYPGYKFQPKRKSRKASSEENENKVTERELLTLLKSDVMAKDCQEREGGESPIELTSSRVPYNIPLEVKTNLAEPFPSRVPSKLEKSAVGQCSPQEEILEDLLSVLSDMEKESSKSTPPPSPMYDTSAYLPRNLDTNNKLNQGFPTFPTSSSFPASPSFQLVMSKNNSDLAANSNIFSTYQDFRLNQNLTPQSTLTTSFPSNEVIQGTDSTILPEFNNQYTNLVKVA